ncbi:unnamed protein product [Sphagnum troendelagicum]|jgi:hypothetical protein|uniref:Glycerophosphoryl diester phosphodiesterase membrane domain-containing protein n=1 Tax=Sphagnum troendelagicum TaxID=128251 RepID=A0ABP0TVN3_9BRYO
MDVEPEDMRLLGIGGILKESYKILLTYLRLFMSLACTLVLPLGVVIFSHHLISTPLQRKIFINEVLEEAEAGTPAAAQTQKVLDLELFGLAILTLLYMVFALVFSLLSTSAIVYSVASIYTGKGLSYTKIISIVPRVWKRLVVTFVWAQLVIFGYYVGFLFIIFLLSLLEHAIGLPMAVLGIPLIIAFDGMLVYINLVWHLASVISVLEESYGLGAMKKSVELIKGKKLVGCGLFLIYILCTIGVLVPFGTFVVSHRHHIPIMAIRVLLGLTLLVLWTALTLFAIIIQSVLYFVCKSDHHETIDRYALSEHLDGYLGEYAPLKGPVSLEALEAELEEV